MAFALLLLPFSREVRRKGRKFGSLAMIPLVLSGGLAQGSLTGCGSGSGFFGQVQKMYTNNIIGTVKGANGATLQHVASVTPTLQ